MLYDAQEYSHLPPLAGLARQPYFRDDGELVRQAGYDNHSRLFGVFDARAFPIKERPTEDDARAALRLLLALIGEFKFKAEHDRAAAVSAILAATTRPSLPLAPAYHVRAPVFSSGKSYLCKLFTAFAGPGPSAPCSYPTDGAEATKTLLALLLTSPAVVEFDDMTTDLIPFGMMNRVLTEQRVSDRVLGESKTVSVSTRALFLSSGNNVGPVRDMLRRVVTINLDPRCQTPALTRYKADPVGDVRRARGKYVAAALTIIEAWKSAGEPRTDIPTVASYNGPWTDYCRHPLVWLGMDDPATGLFDQLQHDPDADALGRILKLWHGKFKNDPKTVREVLQALSYQDDLMDALREVAEERGEINRKRLGWWIRRHEHRIVNDLEFQRGTDSGGSVKWTVVSVAEVF